jgi:predicted alpha/beta-hydrolase family hydrolase
VPPSIAKPISITVTEGVRVSGLLQNPPHARACYVLAHGAGAGMSHPFMAAVAAELARRGIATLRYQFPYMERGARRPDPPQLAQVTVRAAVAVALALLPKYPLFADGKSFGGRMTSQAQAKTPLEGVYGLAFLGFPLHPAGRPSQDRSAHLFDVQIPMLFLQGTRDSLASLDQIEPLCKKLRRRATLKLFADANHSFHVPARSGRKDAQVLGGCSSDSLSSAVRCSTLFSRSAYDSCSLPAMSLNWLASASTSSPVLIVMRWPRSPLPMRAAPPLGSPYQTFRD